MKKTACFLLLILPFVLCACFETSYKRADFFAMNTYAFVVADTKDNDVLNDVKNEVLSIEKLLSATYESSDIQNLFLTDAEISGETKNLLEKADSIARNTDGNFDYTLGQLVKLWDIGGQKEIIPEKEKIIEALSNCGYEKVIFSDGIMSTQNKNILIDLGAIAKGYAGQKVCELLKSKGVENAAVSLGGNVSVIGSAQGNDGGWDVGIKNSFDDTDGILGTVFVTDKTVSVSGSYERFFEKNGVKYHHIFDRKTGYPSQSDLSSVAVICDDGALADALSTALFVMGYEKSMDLYSSGIYQFEAVFCKNDGSVYVTDGMFDSFTPKTSGKVLFPQYD